MLTSTFAKAQSAGGDWDLEDRKMNIKQIKLIQKSTQNKTLNNECKTKELSKRIASILAVKAKIHEVKNENKNPFYLNRAETKCLTKALNTLKKSISNIEISFKGKEGSFKQ